MSFKDLYLLEREDENILSKVTPEANKLHKQVFLDIKKLYEDIFNKPNVDYSSFDRPFLTYSNDILRFGVDKDGGTAYYNYRNGIIYLTSESIIKPLKTLDSIVDSLKGDNDPIIIKAFKNKAKESFDRFVSYWNSTKSEILHELIHRYDDKINKIFSNKYYQRLLDNLDNLVKLKKTKQQATKEYKDLLKNTVISDYTYYNRDAEVNAYFLQALYNYTNEFERRAKISDQWKDSLESGTFQEFKDFFIDKYLSNNYKYWNDSNKRKVIKRLYDFYTKFLVKIKGEDK